LRIDEIVAVIKAVLDADATISGLYPTLVVTHKYDDTPTDEVILDFPYITIRFMSEVSLDQIGTYVDRDDDDLPVQGLFRDCLISLYCWDETENGATKLADYSKKAIFRARDEHEDDGVVDMFEFNSGEAMTSRGPFDSYRAVVYFRMLVKETIT